VRLMRRVIAMAVLCGGLAAVFVAPRAAAQDAQILLPQQSSEKAKALIHEMIEALGGKGWLNVRDEECTGRFGQFGHSGDLNGYTLFFDFVKFPDKDRTEFSKKRNIIDVFNGNHGWVLDQGGVSDAASTDLANYEGDLKKDLDHLLRYRLNEPDMIFRYVGPDVVDLEEADWVEMVDSEGRSIRIAIGKIKHLPIRKVVETRDRNTNLKTEEIEYFSNWQPSDELKMPYQVTRERNGIKVYQAFYTSCKYNTGMSDSLFTKESLEERWQQVGKKKKDKK
jgi:hypothetical protein